MEFVKDLPESDRRGRTEDPKWDKWVQNLRENPNKWGLLADDSTSETRTSTYYVRKKFAQRSQNIVVVRRGSKVFAKYVS